MLLERQAGASEPAVSLERKYNALGMKKIKITLKIIPDINSKEKKKEEKETVRMKHEHNQKTVQHITIIKNKANFFSIV